MVVSFILNTEYMKVEERIKWFLKNASFAMDNDVLIVTHEYMRTHMEELVDGLAERFYEDFEMRRLTVDELRKMNICYIPDAIFDDIYDEYKSQSKWILHFSNERDEEIERFLIARIEEELKKRGEEKPAYIQNCLHTFASVRYIAKYFDCPLLPYVFSAVRHIHGYTQTLYMAHFSEDLFNSDAAERMYEEYKKNSLDFCLFSKKEILALLGKKKNLPLLPLLDIEGIYEMGVISEGFNITPQTYQVDGITDDDLYFETKRWYSKGDIVTRIHPMRMDQMGVSRKYMRNDPVTFILNCKRLSTVQSQMILKAAMWNRVPCVLGNSLPYAFLFCKDFQSKTPISDSDLNFILFCYFVPDSCMFNNSYWKWRLMNPSPEEIMKRHIHEIFNNLGYEESLLYDSGNRFEKILQGRGCTGQEIEKIIGEVDLDEIHLEYLTSRLQVQQENSEEITYYCLNRKRINDEIVSCFEVEVESPILRCDLFLLDDVGGIVKILKILVEGEEIFIDSKKEFWAKGQSKYGVELREIGKKKVTLEVSWMATTIEDEFH